MISINYLPFRRKQYIELHVYFLKKIKEINKKNIVFNILSFASGNHYTHDYWLPYIKELKDCGIECNLFKINPVKDIYNYLLKLSTGIENGQEYSIKLDEDIFINNHVWDYIIENIDVLKNDNNLFLAPILSNGIPTTEMFLEDFCDERELNTIYQIFKKTIIPNMWGANYSTLNLMLGSDWDKKQYYNLVKQLDHHYKGMHPVRISLEANMYIHNLIINNINKFTSNQNYSINVFNYPYFCNSCFAIKTDTWRKIISDKRLFVDYWDEVPLNKYREQNNLNMLFIRYSYGIHILYNTISGSEQIENNFYEKLKKAIIK